MSNREKASRDNLYSAVSCAIAATIGDARHAPPWDAVRMSGSEKLRAALPLMVERRIVSQNSADETLKYWSDRQALTAGNATLSKDEVDFLVAWAGHLETLFWSLVPLDKLPAGMLYADVDPMSGLSTLRRRTELRIENEEE